MSALTQIHEDVNNELERMRNESCVALFDDDCCASAAWNVRSNSAVLGCGHHNDERPATCKVIGVVNPCLTHFLPPTHGFSSIINQRFFDLHFSIGKPFGFPSYEEAFDIQQRNLKMFMDALNIEPMKPYGVLTEKSAIERGGAVTFTHTILMEVPESSKPPGDPMLFNLLKSCPTRDALTRFAMETAISLGSHELKPLCVYNVHGEIVPPTAVRRALESALVEVDFFLHYNSGCGFRASPIKINLIATNV
ncbi:hypothetical protein VNI00_018703 [Paramarasmius palmivorus]|uniref:Uncharacterized protein n=1 Tax=Paramarasmius palmivorus TaxID=297713 RepID=A0AAW0AV06_9AGAR